MDTEPRSKNDISRALVAAEKEVAHFFTSLSSDELSVREGRAWTSAEQLAHLNTAVGAVAKGFAAPKFILKLRFGRPTRPSRSFIELRDDYRARLAAGGRASGEFVPRPADPSASIETRRADLLQQWRRRNGRLRQALDAWSEAQLDAIQLPHPLLGSITAREML